MAKTEPIIFDISHNLSGLVHIQTISTSSSANFDRIEKQTYIVGIIDNSELLVPTLHRIPNQADLKYLKSVF